MEYTYFFNNIKSINFISLLFCLTIILILTITLNTKHHTIYGEWINIADNIETTFSFKEENNIEVIVKNYNTNKTEYIKGIYNINIKKYPTPFNIYYTNKGDHSLYTIIKFHPNNEFSINKFTRNWRTRSLSFNQNKITFKRKQE